ncbi:MFS transporter [Levilactobacillus acidifarinae]|nr:MFS transporter [Levilactobacillus acidifarinae]GEO68301.1 MFS transporter [Levilactobacillus acidifarinae]
MTKQPLHPIWLLVLTSLGFFMSMMDSMIVTTAATAIRTDFHISVTTLQWAFNAYNITIAAVLLVGVALGEWFGRRKGYLWGLTIFTVGSVFCALAPNIDWLIGARVIAGVGASVMTPLSMAILTNALPVSQRGKALGIWGGIGGLALIIGPSLGGLIVSRLAWPWIFWLNVPVGLLAVTLSLKYLPESTGTRVVLHPLDVVALVGGLAGIVWALAVLPTTSHQVGVLVVFVVSGGLSGWFLWRQRRTTQPLVPLSLFASRRFTGGNLATFLLYAAMYGVVFFLPQFLQVVRGTDALHAGLEILPWTGTLVLVAPVAGKLVDRFGERPLALWGLGLQGGGYLLLAFLAPSSAYGLLIPPLVLAGSGLSLAGPALQKVVLGAVERPALGQAAGIYNVCRLLGGAVGTAAAVLLFTRFGNPQSATSFLTGFQVTMVGMGALSLMGLGVAWPLVSQSVLDSESLQN